MGSDSNNFILLNIYNFPAFASFIICFRTNKCQEISHLSAEHMKSRTKEWSGWGEAVFGKKGNRLRF